MQETTANIQIAITTKRPIPTPSTRTVMTWNHTHRNLVICSVFPHTHTIQQLSGKVCTVPCHRKNINNSNICQHAVHSSLLPRIPKRRLQPY
jgi:hypothetical protein